MRILIVPALFAATLPMLTPGPFEGPAQAEPATIAEISAPRTPVQAPAPAQVSGKTCYLSSWMEAGEWRFALDTNRYLARTQSGMTLDELTKTLRELPKGERVYWSMMGSADANGDMAFPSDELIADVQKVCDAAQVILVPMHC